MDIITTVAPYFHGASIFLFFLLYVAAWEAFHSQNRSWPLFLIALRLPIDIIIGTYWLVTGRNDDFIADEAQIFKIILKISFVVWSISLGILAFKLI